MVNFKRVNNREVKTERETGKTKIRSIGEIRTNRETSRRVLAVMLATLVLYPAVTATTAFDVMAEVKVYLNVNGCNNNNICEPGLSENEYNCSNDCNPCNYNNICEVLKSETIGSCPSDCIPPTPTPTGTPGGGNGGGGGGGGGGSGGDHAAALNIYNVQVSAGPRSAVVSWDTTAPTFGSLQWGTNIDYSLGSIDRLDISGSHSVRIDNLVPNTAYYFRIVASLPSVMSREYSGSFVTANAYDTTPPANVTHLTAVVDGEDIVLTWENPTDLDFSEVKILRSPYFYPKNPDDGKLIYEAGGQYVRDANVDLNQVFYYTVFSYDRSGNHSSGALVQLSRSLPVVDHGSSVGGGLARLQDFTFIQHDLQLPVVNGMVRLYPFYDTDISITKDQIPDSVDFLILNITDPYVLADSVAYKLTLSDDKAKFAVRMGVINTEGRYPFVFQLIGFDNKKLGEIPGMLDVKAVNDEPVSFVGWLYILIAIIVLVIIGFVMRRHGKEGGEGDEKERENDGAGENVRDE